MSQYWKHTLKFNKLLNCDHEANDKIRGNITYRKIS